MPCCHIAKRARHPGEIFGLEIEPGERIATMRVEAGGDQKELGPEIVQRGQDAFLESGPEPRAVRSRRQSRIDDVPMWTAVLCGPGAGIERPLMRRGIEPARSSFGDRFGTVSVMHIEIDLNRQNPIARSGSA